MSLPKPTPRIPVQSPRFLSPQLADIQNQLNAMAESERMTMLVDYLDDLRREFDTIAAELKTMGFCAPCYLSSTSDDGDHDCIEEE